MIQTALDDVVSPLNATIEALVARMKIYKRDQENTEEVMDEKMELSKLMNEVNYLKSTNLFGVFGSVDLPDVPEIPHPTTVHSNKAEHLTDLESEAESDKELYEDIEEAAEKNQDWMQPSRILGHWHPLLDLVAQVLLEAP